MNCVTAILSVKCIILWPRDELISATYGGSGAVMYAQNGRTSDGH